MALLACRWLGVPFNFVVATELLVGNLSESTVNGIATAFQDSAPRTAWTYLVILVTSGAIGSLCRRIVWSCRLDTVIPYFRLKHGWFYVLRGRLSGLP